MRAIERTLLALAIVCLSWYGWRMVHIHREQANAAAEVHRALSGGAARGWAHIGVLKTLVVNPRDVWVLDPIPHVSLTLITCYPFVYVGHAPHRFVVQAEKL